MGKLKTIAVSAAVLASLGLSTAALMTAYLNRPPPPPSTVTFAQNLAEVAGYRPDAAKGDRVVKLSSMHKGGNASFEWTCGKVGLTGARAEDHFGHWDNVGGAIAYDAGAGKVHAIEVKFAVDSLQSDNNTLTYTVTADQKWFDPQFKEAAFAAADIAPRSAENEKGVADKAVKDWTHLVKGKFTLNGITQELAIPAKIVFSGQSARFEAQFAISRKAFQVEPRKAALAAGMFIVDDEVRLSAKIVATPDLAVVVAELGAQVQAQQAQLRAMEEAEKTTRKDFTNRLIKLETALEEMKTAKPVAGPVAPPVDPASLPKAFEDALVLPALEKDYIDPKTKLKEHRSYAGLNAPFKMILVPGDPAKGVIPFYIGETEVPWDMFHEWSHWFDTTPTDAQPEVDAGLRPSNADSYADTSHNGRRYNGYPALGVSRKNAEAFCALLSKKTGRTYRLPTEAEWDLAYELGGGDPADEAGRKDVAICRENAPNDTNDDAIPQDQKVFGPIVGKIKTKKPNKLGLYDMLGNVAEWVKTPGAADAEGKNTFVRGGDFKTPAAKLSGKIRQESDNRRNIEGSWNSNYPNDPVSLWWYKDHYQVGFRLVCEPVNLPKK